MSRSARVLKPLGTRGGKFAVLTSLVLVLLLIPFLLSSYYTFLVVRIYGLSILGIGFNLLFGYTDLPSFGHAAFYGLGAYGFAISLQYYPDSMLLAIVLALVAAVVYGTVVGAISSRGRGVYFALLTFAFAQILYEIGFRTNELTGGSDGLLVAVPELLGILTINQFSLYYLSLGLLVVALVTAKRLVESPFGKVLQAIRFNEDRAKAVGYPTRQVLVTIFVISTVFAAIAGILLAMRNSFVSPSVLYFEISIDVLIITIIGGLGTLSGPIVGAVFLVFIQELLADFADIGILVKGIVFIAIVLYAPEGIVGKAKSAWAKRKDYE